MEILLDIKDLSIEYSSIKEGDKSVVKAVNNVSMRIQRGEIYALAGESGCGKSTLAKAITKLVSPKSGEIFYDGVNIYDIKKEYPKMFKWFFKIHIQVLIQK